jgi:xanthine dehydrogenase YagT iron-sulfur-binding subunit
MADTPPHESSKPSRRTTSRRGFLRGTAATGIGVGLIGTGSTAFSDEPEMQAPPRPLDPKFRTRVSFTLNGKPVDLDLDNRATLLDTLRTNLKLTGSKKGCDHGACGACTAHVDGERVLGCLTLAVTLEGSDVLTIEGLEAENGDLHPLQAAFIDCDGYQCGYCTPGQIMSGVKCIDEGHTGSDAEIREWMSGNLCRCGAYPNIVDAIKQASGKGELSDFNKQQVAQMPTHAGTTLKA